MENLKNTYKAKRYVITKNELEFYKILNEITKELDMVLLCQVPLYQIIEVKDYKNYFRYFNKISQKSIDFVLTRKDDLRIRLCIELNDTTHKIKDRIKRDEFIKQLFNELDIGYLIYPVYKKYYKSTLKRRIQENIKEIKYA